MIILAVAILPALSISDGIERQTIRRQLMITICVAIWFGFQLFNIFCIQSCKMISTFASSLQYPLGGSSRILPESQHHTQQQQQQQHDHDLDGRLSK